MAKKRKEKCDKAQLCSTLLSSRNAKDLFYQQIEVERQMVFLLSSNFSTGSYKVDIFKGETLQHSLDVTKHDSRYEENTVVFAFSFLV